MASPFIRAHGYVPGPTERPIAAGLLSGLAATVPVILLGRFGGGFSHIGNRIGISEPRIAAAYVIVLLLGGALYGRVFMRAANDRQAAWLFGICYGFLTWIAGPVTLIQWMTHGPVVVGVAAQLLFAAHLAYGLVLGCSFPYSNLLLRRANEALDRRT